MAEDRPDGPPGLRRRRLRQDRGGHPGRVQGRPGRQAGGGAGADHPAGPAALRHLLRPVRRLPGAGRGPLPVPHPRPGQQGGRGPGRRVGRRRHRHPPAPLGRHRLQGPRPARRRRGAALRRDPQGADQAAAGQRRRPHPDGHADPPDPGDEPHRHPRPHPAQHRPGRAPADPHLRRPLRRAGGGRGHPAGAAAGGAGVLRPQPGAGHRQGGGPAARAGARGPDRGGPRPDGRGPAGAGGPRLLGGPVRRARVHDDHRVGHRHADGQHARRRPRRPDGPGPAPPAAGPGGPGRPAGLRLPLLPAGAEPVGGGLRAAEDDRRAHRAGVGVQDRHARPGDPGRRQPAGRQPVGPHRRRRLRPLRARW